MLAPFQEIAWNHFRSAMALNTILINGAGRLATETSEWLGKTSQNQSTWLREVAAARSPQDFIQTQTRHAKAHYEGMMDGTRRIGAIMSDILQDAVKTSPLQFSRTEAKPSPRAAAPIDPEKKAA